MTAQDMRKNDKTTNYMTEGGIKHWEKRFSSSVKPSVTIHFDRYLLLKKPHLADIWGCSQWCVHYGHEEDSIQELKSPDLG